MREAKRSPELWEDGKRYAFPAFPQLLLLNKVESINPHTSGKHQPGRSLKRPFMTATDLVSGAESSRTVPLRLIVVADSTIAHDVLRRAQEGENFSELARKYSSHPSAQQGGYVGRVAFADLTRSEAHTSELQS